MQARLANTIAFAALHGNPAADIEKGAQQSNVMYIRALDAIPYLTGGIKDGDPVITERDAAVKRYQKLKALEQQGEHVT